MDASTLTPEQFAALRAPVGRVLRYCLRDLIERRPWLRDDPAYWATSEE